MFGFAGNERWWFFSRASARVGWTLESSFSDQRCAGCAGGYAVRSFFRSAALFAFICELLAFIYERQGSRLSDARVGEGL